MGDIFLRREIGGVQVFSCGYENFREKRCENIWWERQKAVPLHSLLRDNPSESRRKRPPLKKKQKKFEKVWWNEIFAVTLQNFRLAEKTPRRRQRTLK